MNWNYIIGIVSSVFLFLPVFFILLFKLNQDKRFAALLIYYISAFIYNLLTEGILHFTAEQTRVWGIANNLTDVPLMMLFLTYLSPSKLFTKRMHLVTLVYVLFEIIIVFIKGFNVSAITITIGPGVILVSGLSLYFFSRYAKMAIAKSKATGKAFISAAVVFAYICFTFLYFVYYVFKTHLDENGKVNDEFQAATYLIYFMITIISASLMCVGILYERKRLHKLKELKITRKELSSIYSETKGATTFRRGPMLDFDKDTWLH